MYICTENAILLPEWIAFSEHNGAISIYYNAEKPERQSSGLHNHGNA